MNPSEASADTAAAARDDKMPGGIPFIIVNEFAERFCFYGINSILTVYMADFLRMGHAQASSWHSLFKMGAYFFPMLGAIVSDVFWGKFRTIMTFSLAYVAGCTIVAMVPGQLALFGGLFLVGIGTGGIKPCVSTNVGDQFTAKNQHLIERAFSYFYFAINAGSSISIFLCPFLLKAYGPKLAFGIPAAMMLVATIVFWGGRNKYVHVPPAGRAWVKEIWEGRRIVGRLAGLYVFTACWWALWDQSNGQTWTLQAESALMDKKLLGITLLPAQVQVVNGLLVLGMIPIFTFVIYPLLGKMFKVTPLRKIGIGLFVIAVSFWLVGRIEADIQAGRSVSAWWQILAYTVITAAEIMVSITGLEFSYKQAPLKMKSFIMAMWLLSVSVGNLMAAGVNFAIVKPLQAADVAVGAETWVKLDSPPPIIVGQKIDLAKTGVMLDELDKEGKPQELAGTYLVAAIDGARFKLMDYVNRKPVATHGNYQREHARISTYRLVGPEYFNFFALVLVGVGVLFIFYARSYKEQTHVREAD